MPKTFVRPHRCRLAVGSNVSAFPTVLQKYSEKKQSYKHASCCRHVKGSKPSPLPSCCWAWSSMMYNKVRNLLGAEISAGLALPEAILGNVFMSNHRLALHGGVWIWTSWCLATTATIRWRLPSSGNSSITVVSSSKTGIQHGAWCSAVLDGIRRASQQGHSRLPVDGLIRIMSPITVSCPNACGSVRAQPETSSPSVAGT